MTIMGQIHSFQTIQNYMDTDLELKKIAEYCYT